MANTTFSGPVRSEAGFLSLQKTIQQVLLQLDTVQLYQITLV